MTSGGASTCLAAVVAVMLAGCAGGGETGQPGDMLAIASVPVVRTWNDLLGQPAIIVRPGSATQPEVRIRIGIEATSCARYDGVLLYGLTDGYVPPKEIHLKSNQPALGPVSVRVSADDGVKRAKLMSGKQSLPAGAAGDSQLFIAPILGTRPGRLRLTITCPAGGVLAETAVTVADQPGHPWSLFMPDRNPRDALASQPDNEAERWHVAFVSPRPDGIVAADWTAFQYWPAFVGIKSVGESVELRPAHGKPMRVAGGTRLPRFCPDEVDPGLKLTSAAGRLFIESDRDITVARADWHFLVRWWINGRPRIPQPIAHFLDMNGIMMDGRRLQLNVAMDRPELGAAAGDLIEVQLLYCEGGWGFADERIETMSGDHGRAQRPEPRLTNRVRFIDAKR